MVLRLGSKKKCLVYCRAALIIQLGLVPVWFLLGLEKTKSGQAISGLRTLLDPQSPLESIIKIVRLGESDRLSCFINL